MVTKFCCLAVRGNLRASGGLLAVSLVLDARVSLVNTLPAGLLSRVPLLNGIVCPVAVFVVLLLPVYFVCNIHALDKSGGTCQYRAHETTHGTSVRLIVGHFAAGLPGGKPLHPGGVKDRRHVRPRRRLEGVLRRISLRGMVGRPRGFTRGRARRARGPAGLAGLLRSVQR